jgi:hypothetical protein
MNPTGGYVEYSFVAEFYDYVVPYRDRQDVAFFVEMTRRSEGPVDEIFVPVRGRALVGAIRVRGRESTLGL